MNAEEEVLKSGHWYGEDLGITTWIHGVDAAKATVIWNLVGGRCYTKQEFLALIAELPDDVTIDNRAYTEFSFETSRELTSAERETVAERLDGIKRGAENHAREQLKHIRDKHPEVLSEFIQDEGWQK